MKKPSAPKLPIKPELYKRENKHHEIDVTNLFYRWNDPQDPDNVENDLPEDEWSSPTFQMLLEMIPAGIPMSQVFLQFECDEDHHHIYPKAKMYYITITDHEKEKKDFEDKKIKYQEELKIYKKLKSQYDKEYQEYQEFKKLNSLKKKKEKLEKELKAINEKISL